jgi:creatinine amidohydrolase
MNNFSLISLILLIILISKSGLAQTQGKPLVIREMSWPDIKEYLTHSDMVIIPMGSTEQHGPHLPEGTDNYIALETAKEISAKTGVLIAPDLLVGYSPYHSGFPGTLSFSSETLEQVFFEVTEYLIKYGFRRIMFFNYHGGNAPSLTHLIERISQETEVIAISIGDGSQIQNQAPVDSFDYHAGVDETSFMLYLHPELIKKDRIQKPEMHFTPKLLELMNQSKNNNQLSYISDLLIGAPVETKKGGASVELSSNGIWTLKDPKKASAEKRILLKKELVDNAVKFIVSWKKIK